MKIRELKKAIKDLPDNMRVIIYNNYDGEFRCCDDRGTDEYWTDGRSYSAYKDGDFNEKETCYVIREF